MLRFTADHYRLSAEHFRVLAELEVDLHSRKLLLRAADDYECLAAEAETAERAARVARMNAALEAVETNIVRYRFGGAAC